jgi:Spy/CpxP family protein refolding chaperone
VKLRVVTGLVVLAFAFEAFGQSPQELMEMKKKEAARIGIEKRVPALPMKGQGIGPLAGLQARVKGTFWRDVEWAKVLDLSTGQQSRMDDIFQQYRLKLIDLTATLQKEEVTLEPLFSTSRSLTDDEPRIVAQIDRIAAARSELEKANARMLLGILQVLTAEQRIRLQLLEKTGPKLIAKPAK